MIHTLFWPYSPAAEAVTLHTEIPPIPKDPRLRYFNAPKATAGWNRTSLASTASEIPGKCYGDPGVFSSAKTGSRKMAGRKGFCEGCTDSIQCLCFCSTRML